MVSHPLLSEAAVEAGFSVLHLLVDEETVQQILRFFRTQMTFDNNSCLGHPWHRHRGVVDVVEPVRVAEAVLRQNHMFCPLTQQPDEYAPAFDGDVYAAGAIAQALADAGVAPLDLHEVAFG